MSDECLLFTLLDTFTDGDGQFPNQIFELTTLGISTLRLRPSEEREQSYNSSKSSEFVQKALFGI